MYTIKLLFIRLSLILFRNLFLKICITKETLFTVLVATDRSNDNLLSININLKKSLQTIFIFFYHFLRKTNNTFNIKELIIIT